MQTGWYDQTKRRVRDLSSAGFRIILELAVRRVACRTCGAVKRERLDFLGDNPHFTRRFAFRSLPLRRRVSQVSYLQILSYYQYVTDGTCAAEIL